MTDTQPPFNVTFELTRDDLVNYLRLVQRNLNSIGIGAGLIGVGYGAYLAWSADITPGAVLAAMGAFLILVSATPYADRLRARTSGKRVIGTQATFTIDEGGISSSNSRGSGHASWASVDNIVESPETIVLRLGKRTKIWLPKRALGSPEESDAILEFIRDHVTEPAR